MSDKRPETTSAWSPLRYSLFRALWVASVVSNLGTWMEEVGEAWLMTDQTASPLLVSLLQTADSLPIFLLALPAGALADIVDRRRPHPHQYLAGAGRGLGHVFDARVRQRAYLVKPQRPHSSAPGRSPSKVLHFPVGRYFLFESGSALRCLMALSTSSIAF